MVGVYHLQYDNINNKYYIKYYHKKYYIEDLDKQGVKMIIDYNNSWLIIK